MGGLSWQHLLIVLLIVLVLFGGSRLAGLGKSSGRALREFKEETRGLRENRDEQQAAPQPRVEGTPTTTPTNTTETPLGESERVQNPTERRDV